MSKTSLGRSLLLALILSAPAFAGWASAGDATVSFNAVGPAGFKIDGKGDKLELTNDGTTLTVSVPLDSLDTGIDMRNRHMLEDLEAQKHPTVTLTVPLAALKAPAPGETASAEARGTFGLHGQTKELPFTYKASCGAETCDIEASASLNVKDFGVKIRSYLGITVKPDVKIGAKFRLKR